eukprot:14021452-Ditylum_brightwellii.AAC.1
MASFFVAHKCVPNQHNGDKVPLPVISMAESDTDPFIVAILSVGAVSFYSGDDLSERACDDVIVGSEADSNCSLVVLAWKPKNRALVVGRDDGHLSIWSFDDRSNSEASSYPSSSPDTHSPTHLRTPTCTYTNDKIHRNKLMFLEWNNAGSRLVSGDREGACCIWRADHTYGDAIMPLVKYQKNSLLTCVDFCDIGDALATGKQHDNSLDQQNGIATIVAFGMENGTMCIANDSGKCSDINYISSCVDHIMFDHIEKRVVVITRSRVLLQFPLQDDVTVSLDNVKKVKLSIPGDVNEKVIKSAVWVAPGVLAGATGENLVRLWDLWTDENHFLPLGGAGLGRLEK